MTSLHEIGEFEVLRLLFAAGSAAPTGTNVVPPADRGRRDGVVIGPGDDAALLTVREGRQLVVTTDSFVEARHYLADWIGAARLGARLAEANLSDLAAMAAEPRWALASYGMRPEHDVDDLVHVQRGLAGALRAHGATIVGGNITAVAGPEWLSLTLLGEVAHGRAWTRFGARPGDALVVTGWPGRAGAALLLAQRSGDAARDPKWAPLLEAWLAPRARVELALGLAVENMVTAAIDVSDGFAGDLGRLCEASGVGARLDAATWPADPLLEDAARAVGVDTDALRFGPTDDYELLLAIDPSGVESSLAAAKRVGVRLHRVGVLTDAPGIIEWREENGERRAITPAAFDHFAPR